jgi:hypothetical protein
MPSTPADDRSSPPREELRGGERPNLQGAYRSSKFRNVLAFSMAKP